MSIDFGEMGARRLPVYLVLDTSGSMQGTKIVGVQNGMTSLYENLIRDPRAASTVHLSVITFSSQAYQMPMVPIAQFTPPTLTASGSTAFGGALHLLNESLDRDILPNTPGRKGDYKPMVFIFTDGMPTDHWETEAQQLANRVSQRPANIIALGTDDADMSTLKRVAKVAMKMPDATPEQIHAFFEWVTSSVKTASQVAAGNATAGGQVQLGPPPAGIVVEL